MDYGHVELVIRVIVRSIGKRGHSVTVYLFSSHVRVGFPPVARLASRGRRVADEWRSVDALLFRRHAHSAPEAGPGQEVPPLLCIAHVVDL